MCEHAAHKPRDNRAAEDRLEGQLITERATRSLGLDCASMAPGAHAGHGGLLDEADTICKLQQRQIGNPARDHAEQIEPTAK